MTVVLHKETEEIIGIWKGLKQKMWLFFLHLEILSLFLLLNDSLFKRRKKDSCFFLQVAA